MRILTSVLLFSICISALGAAQAAPPDHGKVVEQVWDIVNREYLDATFNHHDWDQVRRELLARRYSTSAEADAAIEAMLRSLDDPLTRHLTAEELAGTFDEFAGKLAGIGVTDPWLVQDPASGRFRVLHLVAGSPAHEGGMLPGDILAGIDGESTAGVRRDEILAALRGQPGTSVALKILRDNQPVEVKIRREALSLRTVRASLRKESGRRIAYIELSEFAPGSAEEMRRVLAHLPEEHVEGIVLDLRNNPGGFVQASRDIAGFFLDREIIHFSVDRNGTAKEWRAAGVRITEKPVVVIVNGATASAAEILTGALKDNHRAVVVGTRTFGQGLIHSVAPLSDKSGLVFAVAYFKTPRGLDVRQQGIQPDITADAREGGMTAKEWATSKDVQYEKAVAALLGKVRPVSGPTTRTGHDKRFNVLLYL